MAISYNQFLFSQGVMCLYHYLGYLGNHTGIVQNYTWMCFYLYVSWGHHHSCSWVLLLQYLCWHLLNLLFSICWPRVGSPFATLCLRYIWVWNNVTCSNFHMSLQNCCLKAFSGTLVWCFPWQWFVIAIWIFGLLSFYLTLEIFLE